MLRDTHCAGYGTEQNYLQISKAEIEKIEKFEDVLKIVGSYGKYQKLLLYGIIGPFSILLPIIYLNTIFMLAEPDHFCHVPGVEHVPPGSLEEWKCWTIPRVNDSAGSERFSQCLMYVSLLNHSQIPCTSGWDYDRKDYTGTIPTDFNWVCDKSYYVTQATTAAIAGGAIGAIIFAWAGDKLGRKPVFFACCFILVFVRFLSLLVPQYFSAFLAAQFLSGSTFPIIYQLIISIAVEITDEANRAWIYGFRMILWWVGGICILPFLAWLTRSWFLLGLLTTLPGILAMFVYNYVPESPRWLLTQNRITEAVLILEQMANVNGTRKNFDPGDLHPILQIIKAKQESRAGGVGRIPTTKRLILKTILLGTVSSINIIVYGVSFSKANLTGNPFENFIILSLIDLPVGWIGGVLANKTGRRWTGTFLIFVSGIALGFAAVGGFYPDYPLLTILPTLLSKFCSATASLIVSIQEAEIFPTHLRATGIGLMSGLSSVTAISTPYINFLGQIHISFPYVVFIVLSFVGMLAASFLPETLSQSLPETVGDVEELGLNAKYWSFLPRDYKDKKLETVAESE